MNIPTDIKYTNDHEWIKLVGNNEALVGITSYAQDELGDIVFVDIDSEGEDIEKGEVFGTIEAVKTVSDLFMPVKGNVAEVNPALADTPELINSDPYGEGWLIKIKVTNEDEINDLLSADDYKALIEA